MTVIQKLKLIGHPAAEAPFNAGVGGRTDIPVWDADAASAGWADTAGYNKPHARMFGDLSFGTHTGVRAISLNDFLSSTGVIGAVTSKGGPSAPAGPFSTFSLRYYTLMPGLPGVWNNPPYASTVNLMSGAAQLDPLLCWCNIPRTFPQVLDADVGKLIIPGRTALTSAKWINKWVRVEAQFNNAFSPKMVVRLYEADNTTPFQTWSYSPSFTSITSVGITSADNGSTSIGFAPQIRIALLEVCDTYDLDGQFPGGTADDALVTNPTGTGTPETEQTNYVYPANQLTRDTVVTEDFPSTAEYFAWRLSPNMTAAVWIPNAYSPTVSGFPVVMWAHSGFFITGDFAQIPSSWRNTLLNAGYAVVSFEYVKSTVAVGSYEAWGNSADQDALQDGEPGFGRYPSWIIDYKLLAAKLPQFATDNGWNIDTGRIIATGYSAGGYIALGAAISTGVTNDGQGRDLTIAGNPTYAEGYTGDDPEFLGAFCYAPPCDMEVAAAFDTTDPGLPPLVYGLAGYTDRGAVNVAARAFMGQIVTTPTDPTLTGTSIPSMIAARDAIGTVPPVACVWGSGDFLIHKWGHDPLMASAMAAAGADYDSYDAESIHDWINMEFDPDVVVDWLDARITESGGTPGPPSLTPPVSGSPPGTGSPPVTSDPCAGLDRVDVGPAGPTTFTLGGDTITIVSLTGTGGTIYGAVGSGLTADGADYPDPAIYLAAGYGTLVSGTPVNYSVTASLVSSGCTPVSNPIVQLIGVVDGEGVVIANGTATDVGGGVWHLALSYVMTATWTDVYVITTAPTECA